MSLQNYLSVSTEVMEAIKKNKPVVSNSILDLSL